MQGVTPSRALRAELVATRFPLLAAALPSIADRTLARPDPATPSERDRTVPVQSSDASRAAYPPGAPRLPVSASPVPAASPMYADGAPHGPAAPGSAPFGGTHRGSLPYGASDPHAPFARPAPPPPYGSPDPRAPYGVPGAPCGGTLPGILPSGSVTPPPAMPYGSMAHGYAPAMGGGPVPHAPAVPVAASPWPVAAAQPRVPYPAYPEPAPVKARRPEDASLASVFHALNGQQESQPAATPQAELHDLFLTLGR